MKRIICVGNRYIHEDAAGPKVYDYLLQRPLPCDVEVIDGGLGGLDLLRFVEGARRVVFVDTVFGYARPKEVVVLDVAEAAAGAGARYGHSGGLAYLLRVLPKACDGVIPDVLVVGIEELYDNHTIEVAAELSRSLVSKAAAGISPGRA